MTVTQDSTRAVSGRHRTTSSGRAVPVVARRVGKSLIALLSATVLLAMGYYRYTYNSLDNGLHRVAVGGLGSTPTPAAGATVTHVDGTAQNLLIIGNDSRAGLSAADAKKLHVGNGSSVDGTDSTDTLMVVHVPADGSKATLISIPRDSYVDIPGFQSAKINAAYADGYYYGTDGFPVTSSSTTEQRQAAGLTLLIQVIKNLTGLAIDHYVMVNFIGFYDIAKAIGGISVNLCHAVNDSTARNEAAGNGAVGSGFVMSAGRHDLTPVQSLKFVRQRHFLPNGDLDREARQRYFLAAAFQKVESAGTLLSPGKLNSLISAVKKTLTLDDRISLPDLARQMNELTGSHIVGQTIPNDGTQMIGDQSVIVVDPATVQAQIQKWLNPTPSGSSGSSASSTAGSTSSGSSSASSAGSTSTPTAASKGCIN